MYGVVSVIGRLWTGGAPWVVLSSLLREIYGHGSGTR